MFLGLDRFGTDDRESACGPVDAVAPLEGVGRRRGGCLNELPHSVLAGSGQPGVVHQGVSCLPGCIAEFSIVFPGTGVGLQLKRAQLVFRGKRHVVNIRLSDGNPQHREAEQKSQEAQGGVQAVAVILPLMRGDRML